ncbi:MAG: PEP-CTERM sorting domain-containing protein, partial [Bryobacteraceae bacterium]
DTGGVTLDPTKPYVVFINATNLQGFVFSYNDANPYAGGLGPTRTVSSTNFLTPNSWAALSVSDDLAFTAVFGGVPEPSTALLLLIGLMLLMLKVVSSRRSSASRTS